MRFRRSVILALLFVALAACHAPPTPDGSPGGMDFYAKDIIDSTIKIGGLLLAVVVALFTFDHHLPAWWVDRSKALMERSRANEQRAQDLRWRKASLARDALAKLAEDSQVRAAMRMLDWGGRRYVVGYLIENIDRSDVYVALRTTDLDFNAKEIFIRDCFDTLFGHIQLIEHYLSIDLLEEDDVLDPLCYYVRIMQSHMDVLMNFLITYRYSLAMQFLVRISICRSSALR